MKEKIKIMIPGTDYSKLICLLLLKKNEKIVNEDELLKLLDIKINKNLLSRFFLKYVFKKKLKKNNKKIVEIIGSDHTLLGNVLLGITDNFQVIEDGIENYSKKNFFKENKIKILLRRILNYNESFGINKNVKKIYLTGLSSIPKEIFKKVEIINLKNLWDKKSNDEKEKILNVFSFDINIITKTKGKDIILFTQPLSEDNVITEKEKIDIYSKIITKYPNNKLIIKTHPREKTNYKEIFQENLVLENSFPFEILSLLDIKFKKAVTLFSTAALNLGKDTKVDFYGTEINSKIFEKFGSCDYLMIRNCFLEDYDEK